MRRREAVSVTLRVSITSRSKSRFRIFRGITNRYGNLAFCYLTSIRSPLNFDPRRTSKSGEVVEGESCAPGCRTGGSPRRQGGGTCCVWFGGGAGADFLAHALGHHLLALPGRHH